MNFYKIFYILSFFVISEVFIAPFSSLQIQNSEKLAVIFVSFDKAMMEISMAEFASGKRINTARLALNYVSRQESGAKRMKCAKLSKLLQIHNLFCS